MQSTMDGMGVYKTFTTVFIGLLGLRVCVMQMQNTSEYKA
jgi:hypothetical protein